MKILHVINILYVLIYLGNKGLDTNAALWGRNFESSAHLNMITGRAQSKETSWFKLSSPKCPNHTTWNRVKHVFETYPQFLSSKRILFGLVQVKNTSLKSTIVHDAIFGIKLLEFGVPHTTKINNNQLRTFLPITGGCLVRVSKDRNDFQLIQNARNRIQNFGGLTFSATVLNQKDVKEGPDIKIETQILDYPPQLAGSPPVYWMRKEFYLKTQGVVHAYVMYRFHKRCRDSILDTHT